VALDLGDLEETGRAEGISPKIQWIKRMTSGYRNRGSFGNAIHLELGVLIAQLKSINPAHTSTCGGYN
jgi:hypothetical protein